MNTTRIIAAAALLACVAAASAGSGTATDADAAASSHPNKKPTLATTAGRQLQADAVPSVTTEPVDLKAQADADIARRNGVAKPRRLTVERQNLKGDAAARAIAQRQKPSTYDRDIQMGDKDHTEQVTDLKIYLKKKK